jgi:hypothetical protein
MQDNIQKDIKKYQDGVGCAKSQRSLTSDDTVLIRIKKKKQNLDQ